MVCLVFLFTSYSNAQEPVAITSGNISTDVSTGNLINMTGWTGVRYTDSIGVGFCCSGGPNPAMNQDTNTLRFSWGYMSAAQSIALGRVFESIGTGIKITGYNYSWQINNEGTTSGILDAKVSLMGKNGNMLESYNYNYSRNIPGFETFSGTQNFSVDYGLLAVQSLDVTFTGKDNRFWAGYYGPRVRDVNVSLNYTVDASKPTSPTPLPVTTATVDTTLPITETSNLSTSAEGLPQTVQQTAAVLSVDGNTNTTPSVQQTQQQPVAQQAVQPAVQPVVQQAVRTTAEPQKETSTRSSGPSALAMSVVSRVQEAVKTVEKEAVAAAATQAANDVKNAEQQTQAAITMSSTQTTQASQQSQSAVALQLPQQQQQQTSVAAAQVRSNEPQVLQTPQVQQQNLSEVSIYSLASVVTSRSNAGISIPVQTVTQQDIGSYSSLVPQIQQSQADTTQQTFRVQETPTITVANTVRGNPLNDLLEGRVKLDAMVQEQKTEELKRTITNNDLETGVTLATMAIVPQGYALYGISLADAKFYETKPIYQNQRVVDNVRLLRGLGSDQKHQQMVQDQYR